MTTQRTPLRHDRIGHRFFDSRADLRVERDVPRDERRDAGDRHEPGIEVNVKEARETPQERGQHERLQEVAAREEDRRAPSDGLNERARENPARRAKEHRAQHLADEPQSGERHSSSESAVEEREDHDRGGRERRRREEDRLLAMKDDLRERAHDVLRAFEADERGAHREHHVAREEAPRGRAEGDRAAALEKAQVDLSAAVDAVEGRGEAIVELEHRIAACELARAGEIVELQVTARDRVAELAERQEPAEDDVIDELVHELLRRHALGDALRNQAHGDERVFDLRPQCGAQVHLGALHAVAQHVREVTATRLGDARARDLRVRRA